MSSDVPFARSVCITAEKCDGTALLTQQCNRKIEHKKLK